MAARDRLSKTQLDAYFTLVEVGNLLQQVVADQLRADGDLSAVQFEILVGLAQQPDGTQRMTDIADRIVYSRSGLTYQAAKLEERGLIVRCPDESDERGRIVRLTDEGRKLLAKVSPGHIELTKRVVFDSMPEEDLGALLRALGPLRDRLREVPPRSAKPRRRSH
jgi:DNA-binding MarR family transcriptional regulator